jgi:hypothetical protein
VAGESSTCSPHTSMSGSPTSANTRWSIRSPTSRNVSRAGTGRTVPGSGGGRARGAAERHAAVTPAPSSGCRKAVVGPVTTRQRGVAATLSFAPRSSRLRACSLLRPRSEVSSAANTVGGAFPLFLVPDAVEDLGKRPGGSERDYGWTRSPAGLWVRRWKRRVGTDPMRDQRVRFGCPWASSGHEGASNGSFAWQANASANRVRAGQRPTAGRIR